MPRTSSPKMPRAHRNAALCRERRSGTGLPYFAVGHATACQLRVAGGLGCPGSRTAPPVTRVKTGPTCRLPFIGMNGFKEAANTKGLSVVRLRLVLLL